MPGVNRSVFEPFYPAPRRNDHWDLQIPCPWSWRPIRDGAYGHHFGRIWPTLELNSIEDEVEQETPPQVTRENYRMKHMRICHPSEAQVEAGASGDPMTWTLDMDLHHYNVPTDLHLGRIPEVNSIQHEVETHPQFPRENYRMKHMRLCHPSEPQVEAGAPEDPMAWTLDMEPHHYSVTTDVQPGRIPEVNSSEFETPPTPSPSSLLNDLYYEPLLEVYSSSGSETHPSTPSSCLSSIADESIGHFNSSSDSLEYEPYPNGLLPLETIVLRPSGPYTAGTDLQFWIQRGSDFSKIGTIEVSVHGPSGARYPVEIWLTPDDRIIACLFHPVETGTHHVAAVNSFQDLPGSPFHVIVRRDYAEAQFSRSIISIDLELKDGNIYLPRRRPWGITAAMSTEEIFVADRQYHQILVYGPEGDLLRIFGGRGQEAFFRPTGLAFDEVHQRLLVTDKDNHRVLALTPSSGELLFEFGCIGSLDGQFRYPWGIAVSPQGDLIAVADTSNNRIQFFDSNGNFLSKLQGCTWKEDGPLEYPRGLAFDPSGYILYATDFKRRNLLQIYLWTLGPKFKVIAGPALLVRPAGIAVDLAGRIIVADTQGGNLKVLSPKGQLEGVIQQVEWMTLEGPTDVTLLRAGFLTVMDRNGRVRVF